MATEKRLIEIPTDGIVRIPIMRGEDTVGVRKIDLSFLPTVDAVEVVHGRWLFDRNTERYFCSACNEEALYTSKDVPIFDYDWEENLRYSHTETILEEHLTNYCPNCGAKVDKNENP